MRLKGLIVAAAMLICMASYAQTGIVGGVTSKGKDVKSVQEDDNIGFHAGLVHKLPMALGFTLQGGLLYNVKGSMNGTGDAVSKGQIGYLEIPLQLQWGLDLRIIRPYVYAEPFIGYGIRNEFSSTSASGVKITSKNDWDVVNRLEYGLGIGAGVELFSFLQVSAKYFWNFETAAGSDSISDAAKAWWDGAKSVGKDNFTGLALTVGIFF